MRVSVLIISLLTLVACSPAPSTTATDTAPAPQVQASAAPPPNNCPATATSSWSAGSATFAIEATASGATCADADATITIRDATGTVVHTATYDATEITALTAAESVADMQRRLGEWITPAGASMDSTGDLAVWQPGAAEPVDAEVPFHPHEGINREIYEALRTADAPMYCYQQNALGGLCFAMRDGALSELGVQTYAG